MKKTTSKFNVLQVLPALNTGGVERGTADIAKALSQHNLGSFVASSGGKLVVTIVKSGSQHFTIKSLNHKNPFSIIFNAYKLAKLIKEHNIDIIHARSRAPAWSAYLATKMVKCCFLTTFHGTYSIKFPERLKFEYNRVMTMSKKIIAVSKFIKHHIEEVYKISPDKIKVIQRGTDLKIFNDQNISKQRLIELKQKIDIPDDKFIITLPGRLTSWKGHMVLIEALSKLPKEQICCLFVGDTSQHQGFVIRLKELILQKNLEDSIIFTGDVKDMPAIYLLSDLIVTPSIKPEAFGRVPIEAQAMGRIVIASKLGGFKETIKHQENGILVAPGDADQLSKAIDEVIKMSSKKKHQMIKAAKENAEKFSLTQMQEQTLKVYQECMRTS